MDETPLVSVVVPVYNAEPWIDDCVGSLLGQSFGDWEAILVDDASTDASLERCEDYARDERIRVVSRPVGGGAGAARNTGLGCARGKYVYFLDSDDLMVPEALSTMVQLAEQHDLDALFFGAKVLCEEPSLEECVAGYEAYYARPAESLLVLSGEDMLAFMVEKGKFVATPGLQFYRRSMLAGSHVEYPEGIIFEDNMFTIDACLSSGRIGMVPDKLFIRRLRADSLMTGRHSSGKYFRGNFTIAYLVLQAMRGGELGQKVSVALSERAVNFAKLARGDYRNMLEAGERADLSWMDCRQRAFFDAFYAPCALQIEEMTQLRRELDESRARERSLQDDLRGVYESKTFKVGNAVVALPRAIRRALGK